MNLDENGFTILGNEIIEIIFLLSMIYMLSQLIFRNIGDIGKIFDMFTQNNDDYPGSNKYSKDKKDEKYNGGIEDIYLESSNIDSERKEKMIFEENISGVPFRYDERTRVLTIGKGLGVDGPAPIEVNLDSFDDFRKYVDRLEEYIDE